MEKDILNYLPTVMFCETPCTLCASVHSHGFLALVVPNHQVIHIVQGSMQPPVSCPRDWLGLYGWFWRGSWICCCVMWSSLQFGQIFCCCLSQTCMSLGRILYPDLSWDSVHLFFLDSNFSYLLTSGLWLRTLLCCSFFFRDIYYVYVFYVGRIYAAEEPAKSQPTIRVSQLGSLLDTWFHLHFFT